MSSLYLIAIPNEKKNGFRFTSETNKDRLFEWFKSYDKFKIVPVKYESRKSRRYLEGGVVPAYCKWQYGIDPHDHSMAEQRRFLFKQDFHYNIITDRNGDPQRIPLESGGLAGVILDKYTEWAQENGAPVPNPELFKLYRDKWSMDKRFLCFHDFLDFLGLECDAMPTSEALKKLDVVK